VGQEFRVGCGGAAGHGIKKLVLTLNGNLAYLLALKPVWTGIL